MKAQIKIDYSEAKKGDIFEVVEIKGKRVTLNVNDRKVDFGFSEVQIVAPTVSDLFYLGRELHMIGKKPVAGLRDIDIEKYMKQLTLPIKKSLMRKSIHQFIWG